MADNLGYSEGAGKTVAADDVASVYYQRIKLDGGGDGAATPVLAGGGVEASALRVTLPTDCTGVLTVKQGTAANLNATIVGTGTFAVQAAITAASGSVASGAIASGALASGSIAAGAIAAGATSIADNQDVANQAADRGVKILAVRKATPANTSGSDGDYEFIQMSAGRLWTSTTVDAALPAGTNAIGKLAANSGVDIGDVDVTSVPADPFGVNADAASATGSISAKLRFIAGTGIPITGTVTVGTHAVTVASGGIASGAIASGAIASGAVASGAIASGAIAVGAVAAGATSIADNQDVASQAADRGIKVLFVRKATPANTSGSDGDYEQPQLSAGRIWASATVDAALPAGTNNIGDVDVLTVPADPFGANADASSATGSISAKLRFIAGTGIPVTGNVTVVQTTATSLKAEVVGTGTFAVQESGTHVQVDDAAFTPATSKVLMVGATFDDVAPDSVNEGDGGAIRMSANRNLYSTLRDAAGNERGANVNASNQLSVSVDNTVTVASHAVTNAGTFAVQVDGAALTSLQLIDDTVVAQGTALGSTKVSLHGGSVTTAAPSYTTGQISPLSLDVNGGLRVNVIAGAGSGGASIVDDAAFSIAVSSLTPVGGTYIPGKDAVDSGDAGAFAMTQYRAMHAHLVDAAGDAVSVGGGTQYTQDAALTVATSVGTIAMGRASAAAPTGVSADNDAVMPWYLRSGAAAVNLTAAGALIPGDATDGLLVNLGANNDITVTGNVTVTQGVATALKTQAECYQGSTAVSSSNPLQVTLANTGANATAVKVDGSAVTQPVSGTVTAISGTAANLLAQVFGGAAHDGAVSGNPVLIAGYAKAAAPTDVSADGDAVRAWYLLNGAQASVLTAAGALIGGDATNGLDVDVTRLPALVAGSALIGKVGIDQTTVGTTNAVSLAQIGATTVDSNSGNKSAGTIRMVLATDQPALTNKLLVTPDLPSGASTAAKQPALGTAGTASADVISVQGVASMTAVTVTQSATTAGTGLTTMNASSCDGGTALTNSAQVIKATAGKLMGYYIYNPNATAQFVLFYNTAAASVTVGTTNPLFMLAIPATSAANLMGETGIAFTNAGWSWAATSTAGGNGAPTTALDAVAWYI